MTLFLFISHAFAQDSTWQRTYSFQAYNQYDLRNSSYNGITAHQLLQDAFRKGLKPKMNKKLGEASYGVYSFITTYLTMVWSHEFGHVLRAKQVGGKFKIHDGDLPIPGTTMHLPDDIINTDRALSVTGGFEVNYLTTRKLQREFIANNGSFNEDLGYGFANRLMFPIYTTLIVPIDPKDRDVWINTAGDPVHCVLPIFQEYSNNKVFMPDSSVNPELVEFYQQTALFATFFNLLDPQLYREAGATFGNASKIRRPIWLLGDFENGWTYGTLFNMSPLGYELYMNNYIHFNKEQYLLYFKYGNPFKNNGLGIRWNNAIKTSNLDISAMLEVWDQDLFGKGASLEFISNYRLNNKWALNFNAAYKSKGYLMGKQIKEGANLGFGLSYTGSYFN